MSNRSTRRQNMVIAAHLPRLFSIDRSFADIRCMVILVTRLLCSVFRPLIITIELISVVTFLWIGSKIWSCHNKTCTAEHSRK